MSAARHGWFSSLLIALWWDAAALLCLAVHIVNGPPSRGASPNLYLLCAGIFVLLGAFYHCFFYRALTHPELLDT